MEHDENPPEQTNEERGALVFTIVAVFVILLIGSPCICYFGAGLAHGLFVLDSGDYVNPARSREHNMQRDPKYDRKFDENGEPIPSQRPPSAP